jgi:RNA polymerase-binding transcription factor DksA
MPSLHQLIARRKCQQCGRRFPPDRLKIVRTPAGQRRLCFDCRQTSFRFPSRLLRIDR